MLSPHTALVQFGRQPSWGFRLPSSHSSPSSASSLLLPHKSPGSLIGPGTSSSSPQAIKFIASSGTANHRVADLGLRLITYPPRVQNTAVERRLHRTAVVKRRGGASQLVLPSI